MGKERFKYYSFIVGLAYIFLPIGAIVNRKPQTIIPLIPMGTGWCFQYDMFYGNMQIRAQKEAARMIKEEPEKFFLPEGSGILSQSEYNLLMGIPENYQPKIK